MINKRGQSMGTNTIILLILELIVLVVLILGFAMGWEKIAPWISKTNVDNIKTSCEAACSTNSQYDFCNVERNLVDGNKNKIKTSCFVLTGLEEFQEYSISSCDLNCDFQCNQIEINDQVGTISFVSTGNFYDVSSLADGLQNSEFCVIPIK